MRKISKIQGAMALVGMLSASSLFAAELIVTKAEATSKSGRVAVSLDIASEGNVTGFQFVLRSATPLKAGSVDISKCTSDLPKGFSGACRQHADGVYFSVLSGNMTPMPQGMVSVGKLYFPAGTEKGSLSVDQLVMIDGNAETISARDQVIE